MSVASAIPVYLVGWYLEHDLERPELGGTIEHVVVGDEHAFPLFGGGSSPANRLFRDTKLDVGNGRYALVLSSEPIFRTPDPELIWVREAYGIRADDFSGILIRVSDDGFELTDQATAFPLPELVVDNGDADPAARFALPGPFPRSVSPL